MTLLIDVREADEYAEEHAAGAVHVPLMAIACGNLGILADVDKSARVELYCHSGNRSERARELLLAAGFTDVVNLGGLADVQMKRGSHK